MNISSAIRSALRITVLLLLFHIPHPPAVAAAPDQLARDFFHPPAATRPWTYWFIMDGNLTREGITADFEALQQAGIGGVIIMEVNVGVPRGPVDFMSPEWRALFRHAVREAERLGLQITLNAGPGWTGSGGPWVKPEQSMQHLVASATQVTGPKPFDAVLPQPKRRPAYFGERNLPPELKRQMDEFYRDVMVLAFPTPTGKVGIADIDEKALYVRHPYTSRPGVKPSLPMPASFPELPPDPVVPSVAITNLTDRLEADGRLRWAVPPGDWTILRFGRVTTGANTRPAPAPGLGLECDKFDPAALDAHFAAFIETLLRELGPVPRKRPNNSGWTFLHIDSWEMGAQNWTAAMREEFRRRRGYDLWRYLPVMTGRVVDSLEVSERFLWDLRQTAQELVIENHARHLKNLGRRHGFGLSIEPYDMNPCADMSLGAVADVPMCEFWLYGFDSTFSVIEAASIAHTLGRPIVAAEAFTSSSAERWQAHPGSMKTLGDWAFCAGVNRIVFHRYQHQPWLDRVPGMTMGPYGVHWERTQTWWDLVPAYHTYLARCQFLLRQGLPVADILYLQPEGAPHVFRPPASATTGRPPDRRGYNFDGITPEALRARVTVRNGRLVLPDGMQYRVLVLPERETMTPQLLRHIRTLAEAGATIIGPPPVKSPSLTDYPRCDQQVAQLAKQLWGDRALPPVAAAVTPRQIQIQRASRSVGRGRVINSKPFQPPSDSVAKAATHLTAAQWIWYPEGNPAAAAPVGRRFFRRTIEVKPDAKIRAAHITLTADNAFELFVNGQRIGTGDNFHQPYTFEVTRNLRPGRNALAVVAENAGDVPNPAGWIGVLTIEFAGGDSLTIPTDAHWLSAMAATEDWQTALATPGGWRAAMELGPPGMAPWGKVEPPPALPEDYCDYALVAEVLRDMGVPPDFESAGPFRYIHRQAGATDIYFVANRTEHWAGADCTFRVTGKTPELWHPMTGAFTRPAVFHMENGRTRLPLFIEPAGSVFVVFREHEPDSATGATSSAVRNVQWNGQSVLPPSDGVIEKPPVAEVSWDSAHRLTLLAREAGRYELTGADGRTTTVEIGPLPPPQTIHGPWTVRFQPGRGAPGGLTLAELVDWAKHEHAGVRHFSGQAIYTRHFDLAPPFGPPHPHTRIFLDLGDVQVMARVKLNGQDLGVLWKRPFRVEVTKALRPGKNELGITVANLWPNRLIGDQALPPEKRITWTTWNPFRPDSPLLPSGLLGPVRLEAAEERKITQL